MWSYEGVNSCGVEEHKPYDMHCPLMGSGFNYYKTACETRQLDKSQPTCFGGCNAKKYNAQSANYSRARKARNNKRRSEMYALFDKGLNADQASKELGVSNGSARHYRAGWLEEKRSKNG